MKKSIFSDTYSIFIETLIQIRKDKCILQKDLAEKLEKPQSFISKYESKERRLDIEEFLIISEAMGVSGKEAFLTAYEKRESLKVKNEKF